MFKLETYETEILLKTKTNKYLKTGQYETKKAMIDEYRLFGLLIFKKVKQMWHN